MPNKFLPPQTNTATRTASTPIQGEMLYDINENQLYYGDGLTIGGKRIQSGSISTGGASLTDIWLYGGF